MLRTSFRRVLSLIVGSPPRNPDQIVVKNAEEARKVVRDQKRAWTDFIKVMDRLSRDEYFAIIDEAKRQDITVVGHVSFAISAWEASASGRYRSTAMGSDPRFRND